MTASLREEGAPIERATETLAELKALRVGPRHPGALILGADTMLECAGRWLGKAADLTEAREVLPRACRQGARAGDDGGVDAGRRAHLASHGRRASCHAPALRGVPRRLSRCRRGERLRQRRPATRSRDVACSSSAVSRATSMGLSACPCWTFWTCCAGTGCCARDADRRCRRRRRHGLARRAFAFAPGCMASGSKPWGSTAPMCRWPCRRETTGDRLARPAGVGSEGCKRHPAAQGSRVAAGRRGRPDRAAHRLPPTP